MFVHLFRVVYIETAERNLAIAVAIGITIIIIITEYIHSNILFNWKYFGFCSGGEFVFALRSIAHVNSHFLVMWHIR